MVTVGKVLWAHLHSGPRSWHCASGASTLGACQVSGAYGIVTKNSAGCVVADSRVNGMVWRALGGMDACANHVMVCYHASKTMSFPLPLRAVSLGPLKQTFRHQSWLDHSPSGKTTQTQTQHRRHFLHSKFLPKAEFKQTPEKHPDYPQNFPNFRCGFTKHGRRKEQQLVIPVYLSPSCLPLVSLPVLLQISTNASL